jgi:hypothetical protein
MYGLLYECKFLTIEETNKKKKKEAYSQKLQTLLNSNCTLIFIGWALITKLMFLLWIRNARWS